MFSTPLICSSNGVATVSEITAGFAPGKLALTIIEGGETSGYSEIGSENIEILPAIKINIDKTDAKIGLSIKNPDMFMNIRV
jgi:hypothetical protein